MAFIDLPTSAGAIPAWLDDPGGAPRPGIVILQEIFGVNAAMRDEAARWSAQGYVVLVPDLFHRLEAGVALNYTPDDRDKALKLWAAMDLETAIADTQVAAAWLRTSPRCSGAVASIGFCLGGKLAVLAGNAYDANVSFYPVQLQDHREEIDRLDRPMQMHIGTSDTHIAPEVVSMLSNSIGNRKGSEVWLYDGAEHAFYNSFREIGYAPFAAQKARDAVAAFLTRNIG